MGSTTLPAAGGAAAMLLVGTSAAVSAMIADYPVLLGQALRYALAAVILLLVARRMRLPRARLTTRELILLLALSATGLVGFNVFLVEATRHASPAMIGSVVGAVPIVLAIAGPVLQRRRPTARLIAAAVVVTSGVVVAAGFGGASLHGVLLSIGALLCEVAFSLLAVPLLPKLGALRVAAYPAALSVIPLVIVGVAVDGAASMRLPTPTEAVAFGYLGAIVTALAFLLWYQALHRLGADRAGLFAGLVPVGALLTTAVLGVGVVYLSHIIGTLLVTIGVLVGMRPSRTRALIESGTDDRAVRTASDEH